MRKIVSSAILAGVIAISSLLGAGTANATVADDAYIATLDHFDVSYQTESGMIKIGHGVCNALDTGMTVSEIGYFIYGAADIWTISDSGHIVGAAIGAYCPEYDRKIYN